MKMILKETLKKTERERVWENVCFWFTWGHQMCHDGWVTCGDDKRTGGTLSCEWVVSDWEVRAPGVVSIYRAWVAGPVPSSGAGWHLVTRPGSLGSGSAGGNQGEKVFLGQQHHLPGVIFFLFWWWIMFWCQLLGECFYSFFSNTKPFVEDQCSVQASCV